MHAVVNGGIEKEEKILSLLKSRSFEIFPMSAKQKAVLRFWAKDGHMTVSAFKSGKVVCQGQEYPANYDLIKDLLEL